MITFLVGGLDFYIFADITTNDFRDLIYNFVLLFGSFFWQLSTSAIPVCYLYTLYLHGGFLK